jgi:hypothetical protein
MCFRIIAGFPDCLPDSAVKSCLPDFRIAASGCPCREVLAMPIAGLIEKAGLDNRLGF